MTRTNTANERYVFLPRRYNHASIQNTNILTKIWFWMFLHSIFINRNCFSITMLCHNNFLFLFHFHHSSVALETASELLKARMAGNRLAFIWKSLSRQDWKRKKVFQKYRCICDVWKEGKRGSKNSQKKWHVHQKEVMDDYYGTNVFKRRCI